MTITRDEALEKIRESLVELDEDNLLSYIDEALRQGVSVEDIVFKAMSEGMREIGRLYETGEYFLAELMQAAEIFKKAIRKLNPLLEEKAKKLGVEKRDVIVIGTVKGDIHDIGKNIVATMLSASGFKVIDLGVDVDAEKFIEAVEKHKPKILGMSALLTTTAKYMEHVIKELEKRGLRSKVKVIVGGAAVTNEYAKKIGADGWAKNAVEALRLVEKLLSRKDS